MRYFRFTVHGGPDAYVLATSLTKAWLELDSRGIDGWWDGAVIE